MFTLVRRYRPGAAVHVLLLASMAFCALAGWGSLAFLTISVLGNFLAMSMIRRAPTNARASRAILIVAILANLAPLVAFKISQQWWWVFTGQSASGLTAPAMPLGLAFYTLQQITFLIDAQRPDAIRLGFFRFATWASFFGQLPAGPIAGYRRMAPQYARLGEDGLRAADVARGTALILAGIVKKMWLADPIARKVDAVLLASTLGDVTPLEAWTGAWGFLLQLYFDFSAYSDIAIGVGLCFGLRLPINFNSPLKATTPGQYILRWHISLMMFVRDYVFEPLFKIARRLPVRPSARRYAIAWALATLGSYLAVAAWHTLAPVALLQGLLVTVAIVGFQFVRQTSHGSSARRPRKLWPRLSHLVLLLGAAVTALCLRAGGEGQLARLFPALFDANLARDLIQGILAQAAAIAGWSPSPAVAPVLYPNARLPGMWTVAMMAAASAIVLYAPNTMEIFGIGGARPAPVQLRWRPTARWGWITIALLVLALMGMTRPVHQYAFIYARF